MTTAHMRCFWRWPIGHRWENVVERRYAFKRCRECGKTTPLSAKSEGPPPNLFGGAGE